MIRLHSVKAPLICLEFTPVRPAPAAPVSRVRLQAAVAGGAAAI